MNLLGRVWLLALVLSAGCGSVGAGAAADAGLDSRCSGPPLLCCDGCRGDALLVGTCTESGQWQCPPGFVSPQMCADAGVPWCIGPFFPLLPDGGWAG